MNIRLAAINTVYLDVNMQQMCPPVALLELLHLLITKTNKHGLLA